MAKVFISYRRQDAKYPANRLYNTLKNFVPNPRDDIFIDIDSIPAGVDFVEHLTGRVAECEVLLVLVGEDWLDAKDPISGKRRIDNPDDFVRIEIAAALKRNIPVVPVLLDGVPMPYADQLPDDLKPLVRRNGVPVHLTSFEADVARLVERLPVDISGQKKSNTKVEPLNPSKSSRIKIVGAAIAAVVAAIGATAATMLDLTSWPPTNAARTETPTTAAISEPEMNASEASAPFPIDGQTTPIEDIARTGEVGRLQSALKTLGYYTSEIDGTAGPGTKSAAESFARSQGLSAPDIMSADLDTLKAFTTRAEIAVKAKAEADAMAQEATPIIRELQTALKSLGYYNSTIDGAAGTGTQSAAAAFARSEGITAPDIISADINALQSFRERAEAAVKAKEVADALAKTAAQRASIVRELQTALKSLGYYNSTIDGATGPGTQKGVAVFAKTKGVPAPDVASAAVSELQSFTDRVQAAVKAKSEADSKAIASEQRASIVRELQVALKSLGHYSSSIDGASGSATQSAVDAFARIEGVSAPEVGKSDLASLRRFTARAEAAIKANEEKAANDLIQSRLIAEQQAMALKQNASGTWTYHGGSCSIQPAGEVEVSAALMIDFSTPRYERVEFNILRKDYKRSAITGDLNSELNYLMSCKANISLDQLSLPLTLELKKNECATRVTRQDYRSSGRPMGQLETVEMSFWHLRGQKFVIKILSDEILVTMPSEDGTQNYYFYDKCLRHSNFGEITLRKQ